MLFSKLLFFKIAIEIKVSTKCLFMKKHGLYICNPYLQPQSQRKVKMLANPNLIILHLISFSFYFVKILCILILEHQVTCLLFVQKVANQNCIWQIVKWSCMQWQTKIVHIEKIKFWNIWCCTHIHISIHFELWKKITIVNKDWDFDFSQMMQCPFAYWSNE